MTGSNTPFDIDEPAALMSPEEHDPPFAGRTIRLINVSAIVLPLAGFIVAIVLLWGRGFGWVSLGLFAGMCILSGFGVTVGFHRLFTHRSFQTRRWVRNLLAVLGSMALEGPVLKWVATHRRHHQHSDREDDPHSPHLHGHGFIGMIRGLYHAHMGWILQPDMPGLWRYVVDYRGDRTMQALSRTFGLWAILGIMIPTVLGGLLTWSWFGLLEGFLWGGLARIFLVHHITWSINSACHLWGSQPFKSHDHSRNNFVFGVLAMGEGWHNNHHAFPASARHGLRWWEIDVSYWVIKTMQLSRLAWDVKLPAPHIMAAKSATP